MYAQEFNAGFVQGLWYSDKVFAEKTVRVYVAIRNNTGSDLTGTVEFFDNDKRIERNNVSALDGRIIESWADWKPSYGEHTLSATLSRIELHQVGSSTKAVEVTAALAEDIIFVDFDTDGDGIGNKDDIDDDGDGISDEVEEKNGTNPLQFDEPEEDTDETEDENDSETEQQNNNTEGAQGLEQYLAPSRAQETIETFTRTINTTKRNLDSYIQKRSEAIERENNPEAIVVDEDGFGEITRTTAEEKKNEIQTPEIQKGGFVDTALNSIGTIGTAVYTVLLAATSFILGHPILVQLGILIAILFGLYKLARKFGSRPS